MVDQHFRADDNEQNAAQDLGLRPERAFEPALPISTPAKQRGKRHQPDGGDADEDRRAQGRRGDAGGCGIDAGGDRQAKERPALGDLLLAGIAGFRRAGLDLLPSQIILAPMRASRTKAIQWSHASMSPAKATPIPSRSAVLHRLGDTEGKADDQPPLSLAGRARRRLSERDREGVGGEAEGERMSEMFIARAG